MLRLPRTLAFALCVFATLATAQEAPPGPSAQPPAAGAGASKDGSRFGEWYAGENSSGVMFALTLNAGGNALAQSCKPAAGTDNSRCVWEVLVSEPCKLGDEIPVLGNAMQLASSLRLRCGGPVGTSRDRYHYYFTDFERAQALINGGDSVAFAIPTDGDEFRIVRFRTDGMVDAIKHMVGLVTKARSTPGKSGREGMI
jgi:hypothetical protein